MATATPAFSPEQAVLTLRDLGGLEGHLTERTVGTTFMLWGLLTGSLILAIYAFDARDGTTLDLVAVPLLMFLLVIAGIGATNSIWKTRALGSNVGYRAWRIWLQGLGITVAAFALVIVLGNYVLDTNFTVLFTFAAGFVLMYVGIRHQMAAWCRVSGALVAAGLVLANCVLMVATLDLGPEPNAAAALWAVLATGGSIYLAGVLHARAG